MTKYLGTLSTSERVLSDGHVIEPGVEFDLKKKDEDDPHNARLIADGQILATKQPKEDK